MKLFNRRDTLTAKYKHFFQDVPPQKYYIPNTRDDFAAFKHSALLFEYAQSSEIRCILNFRMKMLLVRFSIYNVLSYISNTKGAKPVSLMFKHTIEKVLL